MNALERTEAARLLEDSPYVRIGIVGDFALDAYWNLDPAKSTVSLETGLPTRPVREQRYELGGGANIAANVSALGARVRAFGVVGNDPWGRELGLNLRDLHGVDTESLIEQRTQWATPVFVKPHLDGAEQERYDTADFNELLPGTATRLLADLEAALRVLHLVIVNEQILDSLHAPVFRSRLAELVAAHPGRFIVDSRYHANEYRNACVRVNDREAVRLQQGGGRPDRPDRDHVIAAAEALYARAGQPVFVSRGPDGVVVRDEAGIHEVPGRNVEGPIDIVGAGDSLLAGISLALAQRTSAVRAAEFGILVASVTIRKLRRCGTASPAEVLALLD